MSYNFVSNVFRSGASVYKRNLSLSRNLFAQDSGVSTGATSGGGVVGSSSSSKSETSKQTSSSPTNSDDRGWFSRLLGIQTIEPMKASHSSMLSDKETVYELCTHDVVPGEMNNYLSNYKSFAAHHNKLCPEAQLIGSWRVFIGNQDQTVHLWKHTEGYSGLDKSLELLRGDSDNIHMLQDQSKLCKNRTTVVMLPFSFWVEPKPRDPKHIYEMRSYVLKPGTMIEWGNNWAKGINYRRDHNQDVGGFFSQIGRLYMVFHFWAYKDLAARKKIREDTWRKPGWDTNVAYTVPLMQKMENKIMVPNEFSQLK